MKLIPAKTPGFVKSLFPDFLWSIDTNTKELYLTFDDGPTPEITLWVLEQLKGFSAKATFFCIGNNVEKHPDILEAILAGGHSVGNHTQNHLKGWKHSTSDYIEDVKKAQDTLNLNLETLNSKSLNNINWDLKLFRPPYGKFKSKQAKALQQLGYKIIMWDILSFDWDKTTSEKSCFNNIINAAKEGSIIVMHDSVKAEQNLKAVLPKILEYYTQRAFRFKSLT